MADRFDFMLELLREEVPWLCSLAQAPPPQLPGLHFPPWSSEGMEPGPPSLPTEQLLPEALQPLPGTLHPLGLGVLLQWLGWLGPLQ